MKQLLLIAALLIAAVPAVAQDVPGFPQVPSIPPPPLPKIEIPRIPKLDEVPGLPSQTRPRETFQDRAVRCQHQAGAAGLNPADVGSYTRACVNQ